MNWVSIEDELPDDYTTVLVCNSNSLFNDIWLASYPKERWVGYDGVCRITHWLPLTLPLGVSIK